MGQPHSPSSAHAYYPGLDGLRGVAALCVVLIHRSEWHQLDGRLAHGYLAVDFFFMLSGFVIAGAYEDRIRRGAMGVLTFLKARVIRLYPLIVLGMAAGAGWRLISLHLGNPGAAPSELALLFARGVLTIPTLRPNAAGTGIFPLDGPTWSLFFEVAANLAWVAVLPWLTTRRLAALVAISAVALAVMALRHGGVDQGATPATFTGGFLRVAFPFALGALLSRLPLAALTLPGWASPPFAVQALLLVAALNIPAMTGLAGGLADLACVLVAFPAILVLSAAARPLRPTTERACRWLGEISYPIYILHYPIYVVIHGVGLEREWLKPDTLRMFGLVSLVVILAASQAALSLYDKPVRRWLGGTGRPRPAVTPAAIPAPAERIELADA